jgi:hypothetical protein
VTSIIPSHLKARVRLVCVLAAVAVLVLTASANAWRLSRAIYSSTPVPVSNARSSVVKAAPNALSSVPSPLEVEVVTVRPTGFEPSQITRPPGPYILLIENRSGLDYVTLNLSYLTVPSNPLTKAFPTSIFQVQMPRGQMDWTTVIPGTPGQYSLKESNHSNWSCSVSQN